MRDVMNGDTKVTRWLLFLFSAYKVNFILNSKYSLLSQNKRNQVNSLLLVLWPKHLITSSLLWLVFESRRLALGEKTWWLGCTVGSPYLLPTLAQEAHGGLRPSSSSLFSVRPHSASGSPQLILLVTLSQTFPKMCVTNAVTPIKLTVKISHHSGYIMWLNFSGNHQHVICILFLDVVWFSSLCYLVSDGRKAKSLSLFIRAFKK